VFLSPWYLLFRFITKRTDMKLQVSRHLIASAIGFLAIAIVCYAVVACAECPNETTNNQACKTNDLSTCAGVPDPVVCAMDNSEVVPNNGPFGCRDNGNAKTECVDGLATDFSFMLVEV
jgi:hypothetical protein